MENQAPISVHVLKSDYSMSGKLKSVIIGWCIFLVIFAVTRVPSVQMILLNIQSDLGRSVEWVGSAVNFILNGLVYIFIPMVIGTVITLMKKHPFQSINIYENGIGFINGEAERFQTYDKLNLSWGKMGQSFYIDCKELGIKGNDYGFGEFSQSDVLMNNLKRYSNIA